MSEFYLEDAVFLFLNMEPNSEIIESRKIAMSRLLLENLRDAAIESMQHQTDDIDFDEARRIQVTLEGKMGSIWHATVKRKTLIATAKRMKMKPRFLFGLRAQRHFQSE